ncbi:MAG TPA: dipeptidase PepE [Gaiellaceae bacterium]|nr:dipeptidase PepE [Gaiellaceae bacterium]
MELLLLSNSTAPGRGFLEHALDEIADVLQGRKRLLFLAQASFEPEQYTRVMEEALQPLQLEVVSTHAGADPAAELEHADAVFVGGGNSFRLLNELQQLHLLESLRTRVRSGMPYLAASAGTNLACPTIRTTNDMPIVQPSSFQALELVPFQINPHYLDADPASPHLGASRSQRISEFLVQNDVPVVALREGAWLRVSGSSAIVAGAADSRLFARGVDPVDLASGSDISTLLQTRPRYDTPLS